MVLQGGTLDLNGNNYVVNGEFYSVFGTNVTSNGSRPATLTINASTDSAVRAVISDGQTANGKPATVGLVKGGSKYLFMLSESTYTGSTVVNAGVLQIGEGGTYGSIASSSLVNNSSVIFYRGDAYAFNGNISGKGSISHYGAGPLTLGGANTYTGGTYVAPGSTIIAGNAKALGASPGHVLLGGTLDLNGYNLTVGQLYDENQSLVPKVTNNGSNPSTLTTNTTLDGKVDGRLTDGIGQLALIKAGTSDLYLKGDNSYSGGTTLLAGGLSIDSATALGTGRFTIAGASAIDNNSDAAVTLIHDNEQFWNANFFFNGTNDLNLGNGAVTMNGSRTVIVNAKRLTVGGAISAANNAAFGLTKQGAGRLVLTGNSNYTGVTTVSAGTLQIGEGGTTGSIASASLVNNGVVEFNRGDFLSYGGVISGAGSVVKNGSGELLLWGANKYTGGTVINDGQVVLGNATALGSAGGALTINSGLLDLNGYNTTVGTLSGNGTITSTSIAPPPAASGAVTITTGGLGGGTLSGGTLSLGPISYGALTGSGNSLTLIGSSSGLNYNPLLNIGGTLISAIELQSLIQAAGGTLEYNGMVFHSSETMGANRAANATSSASAYPDSGPVTFTTNSAKSSTFSGNIQGSGVTFVKAGAGILTLSGDNSHGGGTTLLGGGLNINSATALGSGDFKIAGATVIDNTSGGALALTRDNTQTWSSGFTFKGTNDLNLGTGAVVMNAARGVGITVAAGKLTVGGSISGAPTIGLTKAGAGTLILTGNSSYTGATTVSAGTLQIGDGGTSGFLSSNSLVNNSAVVFNRSNATSFDGAISGKGSVSQTGGGTLTLNGANSYSGSTFIDAGSKIVAGNAKALGATTGKLKVDGTLDLNGNSLTVGQLFAFDPGTITNDRAGTLATLTTNTNLASEVTGRLVDGAGQTALVKAGTGILTLSGNNTHSGGTTLAAGGLNLGSATALGSGSFKITGAATLDNTSGSALTLTSDNTQIWSSGFTFKGTNDLNLGEGDVSMEAARGVAVTVTAGTLTVGGDISASPPTIGLTKAGKGTLVLTGNSSYTGATTVSAGTLQIGDIGNSGSLASASLVNSGVVAFASPTNTSYAGVISGAGSVIKTGNGALTLSGASKYTGGTVINDGKLVIENSSALGSAAGALTVNADGVLDLNANSLSVGTLSGDGLIVSQPPRPAPQPRVGSGTINTFDYLPGGSGSGSGSGSSTPTPITLTSNSAAGSTFNGTINALALTLIKSGVGTLTLGGSNSYGGGTVLNAGGLNINNAHALGWGSLTIAGVSTLDNTSGEAIALAGYGYGQIEQYWNANFTFKGTNDLNLGNGAVAINAARTVTVTAGKLTVGGGIQELGTKPLGLTKAGKGTLVLTGDSSYKGATTVSAGTLQIGDGGNSGSISSASLVNNGVVAFNRSDFFDYKGVISGVGSVVKLGEGTLTLTGLNKYTGGTVINGGRVLIGSSSALGSATGALTVNVGGTLDLHVSSISVGSLSGDGSVVSYSGTQPMPSSRGTEDIIFSSVVPPPSSGQGPDITPITLTINSTASSTFNGTISGSELTLVKSGVGTLSLGGSNNYGGGTVLNAGGLNINNADALGSGPLTIAGVSTLDNTSGGAIALANSLSQNWNANFTFKGTNDLNLGNGPVSIDAARTVTVTAKKLTVGGEISQVGAKPLGLTKAGAGTLVLTGNSSYTGATTVSAGTLQIGDGGESGSIASASLVNNGIVAFNRGNSHSYAGAISGKGVVQQNGPGELTLSGVNSHTGGTVLNAGTLLVGSATALGRGVLTLNEGVLGTTGEVSRINIASHLYWDGDAMISLSLDPTGGSELVAVGGKLVMLGDSPLTFDLTVTEVPEASNVSYLLMTVAGGFGNLTKDSFAFTSNSSTLDGVFRIDAKTKSLYFDAIYSDEVIPAVFQRSMLDSEVSFASIEAVPEPNTWMLIALGGLGLLAWRMKRPGARA